MTEPEARIAAVIEVCTRLEQDAAPRARAGLPNDIARAQGEVQVAEHLRELLEETLPRDGLSRGDRVRIGRDRDLAGFEGQVIALDPEAEDGRGVHVELTGAARGVWRYKAEWLERDRVTVKRLSHATGMQLIALFAIVFAAAQWGSRDIRFGVAILFVAFIAFLAGRRERGLRRARRAEIVADFLSSWRFCPVATSPTPSVACLDDAAHQLLDALDGRRERDPRDPSQGSAGGAG